MTTRSTVADQIISLPSLDLDGLRSVWRQHWGAPPALRSRELLRLLIAWRLQAGVHGRLGADVVRLLRGRGPVQREGLSLGAGAILRRTWQGRTVEVVVEADGFRWQGKVYGSLSAVATAIAGTRWNGPRFFGLREKRVAGAAGSGPKDRAGSRVPARR